MKLSRALYLTIVVVSLELCGSVSPKHLNPVHRTKRTLYPDFVDKHIMFVKGGRKPTYDLLKGRLPNIFQTANRRLHTFIVVSMSNSETEREKKTAVLGKLDSLISQKIANGGCKASRNPNNPAGRQTILNVKPNTVKNSDQTKIPIKDYYNCPIQIGDLGKNIYLANFNVQDKNDNCEYSDKGVFTVGVAVMTGVDTTTQRKTTSWFLVNHLAGAEIQNGSQCE